LGEFVGGEGFEVDLSVGGGVDEKARKKTRKMHEKDGKLNLFFGRFLDNIFDITCLF
jgi:hypothetical protein